MAINIVCSDTYIDAFSRLDRKIQKKSLETIRLMQRSLKSDGLKVEKLNTKLDFKSARVTQDFRVIFTQSGNTVLFVYIDHHDAAYLWASNRLQGFDAADTRPVYEYFEQAKKENFDIIAEESIDFASRKITDKAAEKPKHKPQKDSPLTSPGKPANNQVASKPASPVPENSLWTSIKKGLFALFFLFLGSVIGMLATVVSLM